MALLSLTVSVLLTALVGAAPQSKNFVGAPETFHARAQVSTDAARGDVYLDIHVQKYTADKDREAVLAALQTGGAAAFVDAVRKAPVAGQIQIGKQTFTIRWAREVRDDKGRTITLVTEKPVYFVGAGLPGAKSRAGYDVAVVQLKMDPAGVGEGVMAAAAKVKPGEPTGVQVDDYGSEPIKLLSVTRKIQ
jgi:hypothetical protein